MKHTPLIDLVYSSVFIVTALYGLWGLSTELIRSVLPFGLLLALALFCAGYFLRVPPPSEDAVEAVAGKDPFFVTSDNNAYVMKSVAHRGAGLDAPENSLAAFNLCAEKGCDAIEFDVILTKDDVPVVFHDVNLERMTDLKLNIPNENWSSLADVDISVKHIFKDRFAKTNIPTLEQTVTQLLNSGQRMIIDIKQNNKKIVQVIHSLFERHPDLYSRAIVSSFFPNIIYLIRRGNPKIVGGLAWRPYFFTHDSFSYSTGKGIRRSNAWYNHYLRELFNILNTWALQRITYYLLGLSFILIHKDGIKPTEIVNWRSRGVRVMAWTANAPAEKQYFARVLKITYLTDTLTGEGTTHAPLS